MGHVMPDTEHPRVLRTFRLVFTLLVVVGGGVFTNDLALNVSVTAPATILRYTLDGSEPTELSKELNGPLAITNTTLVRARAFAPGHAPGAVVSHTYVLIEAELLEFHSNLPLI